MRKKEKDKMRKRKTSDESAMIPDSPPFPSFENLVKRRRRRRFLLSRWFIELSRRRLHFLSFVSFPLCVFFVLVSLLFSLSILLFSCQPLAPGWMMNQLEEREKTASRLFINIKSFSLSVSLVNVVQHSSFLIPHPKSSQKGDEKIPHQTSSSFTSFIL